jgi:DNA-directed RNA polymerase subunit K/omega
MSKQVKPSNTVVNINDDESDIEEIADDDLIDGLVSESDDDSDDPEENDAEQDLEQDDLDVDPEAEADPDYTGLSLGSGLGQIAIAEEELEEVDIDEFEDIYTDTDANVDALTTTPYLTKYEFTKVIAIRTAQLDKHAPPTVGSSVFPNNEYPKDTQTIALAELRLKRLPFLIKRPLPNGENIKIPVSDLIVNYSF